MTEKGVLMLVSGVIAILFCVLPAAVWSCSCMPTHPQERFCKADFVVKARVKGSKLIYRKHLDADKKVHRVPFQRMYHIRISKVFKETELYMNISRKQIYTAVKTAQCGLDLKNDTKYLLEGYVSGNKAFVHACNWIDEWNKVPIRQRKGASFIYEQHCKCQVKPCWGKQCESSKDVCNWRVEEDPNMCFKKHSMCMLREGHKRCIWARTASWKECMHQAKPGTSNHGNSLPQKKRKDEE